MTKLLRWLLLFAFVAVSAFIPLEAVLTSGMAWLVRLTCVAAGIVWAADGVVHLRHWFAHKEAGTALALVRIAIGFSVIWTVGGVIWADLVDVLWVTKNDGGYRHLTGSFWLVQLLGGPSSSVMWGLSWMSLAGGACMMMGLGGRLTVFATLQAFMAVSDVNSHAGGSYDELLSNALWILVLAPSTATLSLDCRIRRGRWHSSLPVAAWPRYLLIYQIVVVYWTTGLQKVSVYWVPGGDFMALYYIMQQPSWHRFDMTWLAWVVPLTQFSTAITWFWEVLSPVWLLALWYRYTSDRPGKIRALFNRFDVRTLFTIVGLVFHILLTVFMDVGPFSMISVCFYLAFWHPDEWAKGWQRVRAFLHERIHSTQR